MGKRKPATLNGLLKAIVDEVIGPTKRQLIIQKSTAKRRPYRMKYLADNKDRLKQERIQIKIECLNHYGHKCACCGEAKFEFLSFHHINNDGNKHRQETGLHGGVQFHRWLRENNYPTDIQTLCFNCNFSRGAHGYCPHQNQNSQSPFGVN